MNRTWIMAALAIMVIMVAGARSAIVAKKPLLEQAPKKYVSLANPVSKDAEAFQTGKRIYTMKCAKCHETNRGGDRRGPALDTAEIKTAAPGTLYWVLEKGSGDMPSFAKYPDKYRWQLVTFLQQR